MRYIRSVTLISLVLASIIGSVRPSVAQDATPAPPISRPDIAAMILAPADLPEAGYGLESGVRLGIVDEATGVVAYRGGESVAGPTADVAARLSVAGWQARYAAALALPSPTDPSRIDRRIVTYVTSYADPAGAALGFDFLEDEAAILTAADIPGSRTIGEQSEITQDSGVISDTGEPFRSLDLTFRTGNLTAGVLIYDNRNITPQVGELEALADILLARMQATLATGGSGLGARALRLDGDADTIPFHDEAYERRDGTTVPYVAEPPDLLAAREVQYGVATDVYTVYQALVSGDIEPDDDPYLVLRLYRFADDAAATGWLAALPDQLRSQPDGYIEITPLVGGLAAGDESLSLAYAFNAANGLVTQGYLIAVRVGPVVARVQIDSLPPPPFTAIQALAETQALCLSDATGWECPDSVDIPTALLPAAPSPAPAATPATPALTAAPSVPAATPDA